MSTKAGKKSRNWCAPIRFEDYDTSGLPNQSKITSCLPNSDEYDHFEDKDVNSEEFYDVKFFTTREKVPCWHKALDMYGEEMISCGLVQVHIELDLNSQGKELKILAGKYGGSAISIYDSGTILIQGKNVCNVEIKNTPNYGRWQTNYTKNI